MKALIVLKEFLRLVNEEGLDLSELCEQTDLIEKYVVPELEALQQRSCEGCKYGKFGADSRGIEVECTLIWQCARGNIYADRYEAKEQ